MKEKAFIILIAIAAIGGIYFVGKGMVYVYDYFTDITASARSEYIGGAILSAIIALPFWLAVSACAFPIRKTLSGAVYWALNTPAIVIGGGLIIMYAYILFMAVTGR